MNSKNTQKNQEIKYINVAKTIGIILISISHSAPPLIINQFIFLFHVPLFFFIAGYLYKNTYSVKPWEFLKEKLKRLYLPFIKYELLFLFFHNIFFKLNFYDNKLIWKFYEETITQHLYTSEEFISKATRILSFRETEQLPGSLWFLLSLFVTAMFFCTISYIINKYIKTDKKQEQIRFVIILTIFIIGNILIFYNIKLPRRINVSLIALAIFYLGYLYQRLENKINIIKSRYAFFALAALLIAVWAGVKTDMQANEYSNPSLFIIFSSLGAYLILYFSKIIEKKYYYALFQFIGKNTIPIMALHILSFKAISYAIIIIYNYPISALATFPAIEKDYWWIIYSISGIFFPITLIYIIKKIKLYINFSYI